MWIGQVDEDVDSYSFMCLGIDIAYNGVLNVGIVEYKKDKSITLCLL